MCAEKFDLKPAQQCTATHEGYFGEVYKEVYQGPGLVARVHTWTPEQRSNLEDELRGRTDSLRQNDPGPYNKSYLDMAFNSEVYTLGQDEKNLTINHKPVDTGSAQYKEAIAKMGTAKESVNFDAPPCKGNLPALYINLDKKGQ
jgi:hypothetical protein